MSLMGYLAVATIGLAVVSILGFVLSWLFARYYCKPKRRLPARTPAAQGLPGEPVTFASQGVPLNGWFIPAGGNPAQQPTVVIAHGWSRNAAWMLPVARLLHDAGLAVLLYDARGHGTSGEGGPITLLKFAQDLVAAVDYAAARPEVDNARLGVVGHSMGGSGSIVAASMEPRIRALVSSSAFADPDTLTRRFMRAYHIPRWPLVQIVLWFIERWLGTTVADIAPQNRIGQLTIPLLLIHGDADELIPPSDMDALYAQARQAPVQRWFAPGRGHSDVLSDPGYGSRVVEFLHTHLSVEGQKKLTPLTVPVSEGHRPGDGDRPGDGHRPGDEVRSEDEVRPAAGFTPEMGSVFRGTALGTGLRVDNPHICRKARTMSRVFLPIVIVLTRIVADVPLFALFYLLHFQFQEGSGGTASVLFNASLFVSWGVIHSVLARDWPKKQMARLVGERFVRTVYVFIAGLTLMLILHLWHPVSGVVWRAEGFLYWLVSLLYLGCVVGMVYTTRFVDYQDFLGIRTHLHRLRNQPDKPQPFSTRGPYAHCRHPLYLLLLVALWLAPVMTVTRFEFALLGSVYLVVGALLEERNLRNELGPVYELYCANVPMWIPRLWPWKYRGGGQNATGAATSLAQRGPGCQSP